MKRLFIPFLFFLFVTFPIAHDGVPQTRQVTHPPVITHAYAEDKGPYGTIRKIYIEAEDVDADMDYVIVVVDQPGQGRYPADRILLDPQHRNHLKGFLQWNTLSLTGSVLEEGTQITLRVSIIDRFGNESNEVTFPFTFASGASRDQGALAAPFDQENLPRIGYIGIHLINPNRRL